MGDFRTGALEAMLLCFLALLLFCAIGLIGSFVTWMVRSCFPKTPADDGDHLAACDAVVPAARLTDVLPAKLAVFPKGDQVDWLVEGFWTDWEEAFVEQDWRGMAHALKLADQILFKLWRDEFEKSADVRPPIKGA